MNLEEQHILKSRRGVYQDTSENRRLHRVGQRYGGPDKQPENLSGAAEGMSKEARRGAKIFSGFEKDRQKELMSRYREESERFLSDGQTPDVVIGEIEEFLNEEGFENDSRELSEERGLPIEDAQAVIRFLAEVEMMRLNERQRRTRFVPEDVLRGLEHRGYSVVVRNRPSYDLVKIRNAKNTSEQDFYFDRPERDPRRAEEIKKQNSESLERLKNTLKNSPEASGSEADPRTDNYRSASRKVGGHATRDAYGWKNSAA